MDTAPQLYRSAMLEVKQRFLAIDRVLGAKKPRTLNVEFDNEFMWLQIRKIVELVVFGGILADESRYAALQAELKHQDYRLDSKVNKILPKLVAITPHYLPIPIGEPSTSPIDGVIHFPEGAEVQSLERFLDIFNTAGLHLHAPNPLASEQNGLNTSRSRLRTEVAYLKSVLWKHAKVGLEFDANLDTPKLPGNPDIAWLIDLGKPDSNEIRMIQAVGKHSEQELA